MAIHGNTVIHGNVRYMWYICIYIYMVYIMVVLCGIYGSIMWHIDLYGRVILEAIIVHWITP